MKRACLLITTTVAAFALASCSTAKEGDSTNGASASSGGATVDSAAGSTNGGSDASSSAAKDATSSSDTSSGGGASSGAKDATSGSGASSGGGLDAGSSSGAKDATSGSGASSGGGPDAGSSSGTSSSDGASGAKDGAGGGGASGGSSGAKDAGGASNPKTCTVDAAKGDTAKQCPPGFTCLTAAGVCGPKVAGICKKSIDVCGAAIAPVCGCDNKTYNNMCEAQKAGAVVAKSGKCSQPVIACGGNKGKGCGKGKICELTSCAAKASGKCIDAPPMSCQSGGQQQCGCDGNTYPNACYRQKAGVALNYVGPCLIPPGAKACKIGPVKPVLCVTGEYCKLPIGVCAGKGVCVNKPNICDKSLKPVCGCDKKTYGNMCMLEMAGFSLLSIEPCP